MKPFFPNLVIEQTLEFIKFNQNFKNVQKLFPCTIYLSFL